MKLSELLDSKEVLQWPEDCSSAVNQISFNSQDSFVSGSIFLAKKGTHTDGHQFINQAFKQGATWAVIENLEAVESEFKPRCLVVKDTFEALVKLATRIYQEPSKDLLCVGVTGTNGKTSVTYLIEHLLNCAGHQCGVIGTIDHHLQDHIWRTQLTTPDPLSLHLRLREMRDLGATAAALEISSHALSQKRAGGLQLDAAIFTNLTQDHLDYHKTMEAYFEAKALLFGNLLTKSSKKDKWALLNEDDPYCRRIPQSAHYKRVTYGFSESSHYQCKINQTGLNGTTFQILKNKELFDIHSPLIGVHNVLNVTAAFALSFELGLDVNKLIERLKLFKGIPGRLERVSGDSDPYVFVDYAHTPDAIYQVGVTLKKLVTAQDQSLIAVFGCGGDRDRSKRPLMAQAAEQFADQVVITSDNPRSEKPEAILAEIEQGFSSEYRNTKVIVELDRKQAIDRALQIAKKNDVILIAGKGHESTQTIGDRVLPFCDVTIAKELLGGLQSQPKRNRKSESI